MFLFQCQLFFCISLFYFPLENVFPHLHLFSPRTHRRHGYEKETHNVQFAQWRKPAFVFSTAGLPRNSPSFENVLLPALVFPLFTHTLCVRGENTQWKKKRKIALFSHCRFVSPYPRCTLIFTCFLLVNTHRYSAGDPTDKDSSAELEEK